MRILAYMIILANRIFAFSYGNEILNLFEIDAGSLFNERPPPPLRACGISISLSPQKKTKSTTKTAIMKGRVQFLSQVCGNSEGTVAFKSA
jgi:hypothetical protein